jgi:pimeloyl-ACP methyl ester carboxylesterase
MRGVHGEYLNDGNLKSIAYADRLASIRVPPLILVADDDECALSLSETMHAKIVGSKLVIFPRSGHMSFVDQPNLYIASVGVFLHPSAPKM